MKDFKTYECVYVSNGEFVTSDWKPNSPNPILLGARYNYPIKRLSIERSFVLKLVKVLSS